MSQAKRGKVSILSDVVGTEYAFKAAVDLYRAAL